MGESPKTSLRFVLKSKGGKLELVEVKRIEMVSPPPDDVGGLKSFTGHWLELRGKDETVIYRKALHYSFNGYYEVLTGRDDEQLAWESAPGLEKLYVMLAPFSDWADHIAIFTGNMNKGEYSVTELARFQVKELKDI